MDFFEQVCQFVKLNFVPFPDADFQKEVERMYGEEEEESEEEEEIEPEEEEAEEEIEEEEEEEEEEEIEEEEEEEEEVENEEGEEIQPEEGEVEEVEEEEEEDEEEEEEEEEEEKEEEVYRKYSPTPRKASPLGKNNKTGGRQVEGLMKQKIKLPEISTIIKTREEVPEGKNRIKAYKPSDIFIQTLRRIDYGQLKSGGYAHEDLKDFAKKLNIKTTDRIEFLQQNILDLMEQYIDLEE